MEILIISILLILNGIFAMYEIALVSSSKARLETLSQRGDKRAFTILRLLQQPEKILSTIQVGITLIGIVSGAFGGIALSDDLALVLVGYPMLAPYAGTLSVIIVIGLITYFSLVIGELVPKSLALSNPEKIAIILTPFIVFLTKLAYPFVWLLTISTVLVKKLLGMNSSSDRTITEDELKFLLKQGSDQGVIDEQETRMIKDVFRFTDKKANELMTHRMDVAFMLIDSTKEDALKLIAEARFSRYLLCNKSIENVTGIVAVKDLIALVTDQQEFDLQKVASPPLFIPESMSANRLLEIFRQKKTNFGIVVSEYGAVEGIITLHDLTEAILGELPEENEEAEYSLVKRQDGSYLVDGSMNIDDFMDKMGILSYDEIQNEGFTTLGGMAMHFLGKIPAEGDFFVFKLLRFEIVDMDNSRVDKLLVTDVRNVT
ncbi:MAG: HlyC/CorC family transporter [Bacteroidales bacterium]|nr:HlyC/CorC family transporter [Bacteroidales bacterium]MBK9355790.1 HlyC/CorC family transporter [Bacteroidales bacterium]